MLPSLAELYPPPYPTLTPLIRPIARHEPRLQRDMEEVVGDWSLLRAAAEARCSPSGQLVLLTTDMNQLDIAVNLIANLAAVGVHHYLVLASSAETCAALVGTLACVWSTLLLPTFRPKLRSAATNDVRAQWLVRQIYVGRLAAMGFSPMLLDADVVLFANPFELIDTHLPGYYAYFLGDTSAGWLSVNGGTLYVRNASTTGPIVRI